MIRFFCASLLLWTAPLALLGQELHTDDEWHPAPNPQLEQGRKSFVQACGFCHGEDAAGSRAPDLIRSSLVNHDKNGELIGGIIRNGRPDKGMPAFPENALKNDQVTAIVGFLHTRAAEARSSAHVSNDYPLEKLLTGNAEAGKAYFDGAGQCATCHSIDKDLKGIATKFQPLNLQQRFLYPENPKVHKTATVTLPSGHQVKGVVEHVDEFSIAIRDDEGWYRSWDRDSVNVKIQDPLEGHRKLLSQYTEQDVHNLFAYLETLK